MQPLRWVGMLCVLFQPGCAALDASRYQHLQEPKVNILGLQFLSGSVTDQKFRVMLQVINPNDREFTVNGADVVLSVAGQPVAHGLSRDGVRLAPRGDSQLAVEVAANPLTLLQHAAQFSQLRTVPYQVSGHLGVFPGVFSFVKLPFSFGGVLNWDDLMAGKLRVLPFGS